MKQIIFSAVTLVAAFVFWWVLRPIFVQPFQEMKNLIWPAIALAVFSGLVSLAFLLLGNRFSWLVIGLNLIIFAFLFHPKELIIWGGVVVALLFQLSARQAVKNENKNRLKFNLHSVLHSGMGRLITSVLILVSFAYFLNSGIRETAERQELPGPVRQIVQTVVGSYIGENLERQNPSLRAQATEKILREVTNFLKPYFIFVPPVLAFGLFLILQGLSFIFVWLGILLAMLIFWVLKILKLITMKKETREIEVVNF